MTLLPKKLWGCRQSLKAPFFFVIGAALLFFGFKQIAGLSIEVGMLLATAVFIFWYSWETMRLAELIRHQNETTERSRTEMTMQNVLSILPVLIFEKTNERGEWEWLLKNIGNSPAFNINMEIEKFNNNREVYEARRRVNLGQAYCAQNQTIRTGLGILNENNYRAFLSYERLKKSPKPITMEFEVAPTTNGRITITKPPL
ncbi:hypothetical protein IIA95_01385 [Patescibacteria group bacterium]|nr:hypothetical protein [Patescibacteria group bacterium]